MKSKGAVRFFAIALTLVCIYHLSFTFMSKKVENDAEEFASGDVIKKRTYLDSIARKPVYNLGFKKFTYLECKERELNLGLDLKGGMNVTLEVSQGELISALANNPTDPAFVKALELTEQKHKTSQKEYVELFGESFTEVSPEGKLSKYFATMENKDKVNFASSNRDVLDFIKVEADQAIDRSFEILRSRIDKFGVTQPNIQKLEGAGRILVELPGVENPERVRKLLQGSAHLMFWETYDNAQAFPFLSAANDILKKIVKKDSTSVEKTDSSSATSELGLLNLNKDTVKQEADTSSGSLLAKNDSSKTAAADTTAPKTFEEFAQENPLFGVLNPSLMENGQIATGPMVGRALIRDTSKVNDFLAMPEVKKVLPGNIKFLWGHKGLKGAEDVIALYAIKSSRGENTAALDGEVVIDARKDITQTGGVEVAMSMNLDGARKWEKLTAASVGKAIAIVLDEVVYSAPNVQGKISGGRSSISGDFTTEEAEDLANILKSGKLPATTRIVEEAVVGPTLGKESINKGLFSIAASFVLIILFMLLVYSSSGWVADIAVLINLFFLIGILAALNAALTLPGIAGMLLSLAIAVDSNVLINERVKEDLNDGKELRPAIASGYQNAFSAIIDSNITTLIKGVVLLIFGSGLIFGFAVTLIIGIVCSLFTSVLLTRLMFEWLVRKDKKISFSNSWSKNLLKGMSFDFIGKRKIFYAISSLIILAGIVSIVMKGFNFGVDFKGGRTYVVAFENPVGSEDLRASLGKVLGKAPEVKTFGSEDKYKITTDFMVDDDSENATIQTESKINEGLASFPGKKEIVSSSKIGPTIANDIKISAIWSLLIAIVLMFIYILIRFKRWQYALGTIVSLVHVVLVVLSVFTLLEDVVNFSLEIDQAFIAAILTVIGYSINDSVVVFDRVREFLAGNKGERNVPEVVNAALNDTMSRTLITGMTTIFVIIILFFFGGETIKGFSFAMLVGVIVGTYSSICIGTPVLVDLDTKKQLGKRN